MEKLPLTITLAATKGGVGKTTTAIALAQLLALEAGPTTVVDLDPQGSAMAWRLDSEAANKPLDANVEQLPADLSPARLPRQTLELISGSDYAVIDTPPGSIERTDAAIEAVVACGGVVLVPTSPTAMDLPRAVATVEMVDGRAPVVVLLTRVRRGTKSQREARADLAELGIHVLQAEVPLLEKIAAAPETTPGLNSPLLKAYYPVAEEMLDVLEKGIS